MQAAPEVQTITTNFTSRASVAGAGVFYVARMDGAVDIWDYFYRQNEVAYSHKVGDAPLSAVAVSTGNGRLVAVGDAQGTVSLLEVCESLATPQANEKNAISAMRVLRCPFFCDDLDGYVKVICVV